MDIGLRIERLLYFGFFLIILCFIEVYLAETSAFFSDSQTRSLDLLSASLKEKRSELQSAYDNKKRVAVPETERGKAADKLRQRLGMSPRMIAEDSTDKDSYLGLLTTIINNIETTHRYSLPSGIVDSGRSPTELISDVQKLINLNQKTTATVLGIETPRELSLQYGTSDFKIPSTYLATALLAVIYLLAVVWLGSFYITRQRELFAIRQAQDHKLAFPHILNWLPIDFSSFHAQNGFEQSRKEQRANLAASRVTTMVFRCFLILSVEVLILGPIMYSSFTLWNTINPPIFVTLVGGLFNVIIFVLSINLIVQEAISLRRKVFYA